MAEDRPDISSREVKKRVMEILARDEGDKYEKFLEKFISVAKSDDIFEEPPERLEDKMGPPEARARYKNLRPINTGRLAYLRQQQIIYFPVHTSSLKVYELTDLEATKEALEENGSKKKKEAKRKKELGLKRKKYEREIDLSPQEIQEFKEIAREHDAVDYWAPYLNPKISNMLVHKKAILVALAGLMDVAGNRQRIHVLLHGEPGTGKSKLIRWVANKLGHYKTGHRLSDVGLTGDARGKKVKLGKLPKAHGDVVCVDELDKVDKKDRDGLYESMSDGTVTITVGDKDRVFKAEATVLAALNEKEILRPALLNRFDFVLECRHPIKEKAKKIVGEIVRYWGREKKDYQGKRLRRYLYWVRGFTPKITGDAREKVTKAMQKYIEKKGGDRVKVRKFERFMRIARAVARLNHRNLTKQDLEKAWALCPDADTMTININHNS